MRIKVMLSKGLVTRSALDVYDDDRHLALLQIVICCSDAVYVDIF